MQKSKVYVVRVNTGRDRLECRKTWGWHHCKPATCNSHGKMIRKQIEMSEVHYSVQPGNTTYAVYVACVCKTPMLRNGFQNLQINRLSPKFPQTAVPLTLNVKFSRVHSYASHTREHIYSVLLMFCFLGSSDTTLLIAIVADGASLASKCFSCIWLFCMDFRIILSRVRKISLDLQQRFHKFKCYSTRNDSIKTLSPHTNKNCHFQRCWWAQWQTAAPRTRLPGSTLTNAPQVWRAFPCLFNGYIHCQQKVP